MSKEQEKNQFELQDMSFNSEQHEILLEASELKQQLSLQSRWSYAFLSTRRKTFYTTLLLLFIVSGIMVITIGHYTAHNKDKEETSMDWYQNDNSPENTEEPQDDTPERFTSIQNNGNQNERLPQLRADSKYRRSQSPERLGYMNIYIRKPTQDGTRRPKQFRFPVARYNRQRFPLTGPFLSFAPWIPIFADRLTRQTIIYSSSGVYILPPLINFYGKMFSVAELIVSGYASLVSSGAQQTGPINMIPYFHPIPLYGTDIPRINPLTGSFLGGIRTNYGSFITPKYPGTRANMDLTNESEEEDDDRVPSYSKNNYYKPRPHRRPSAYLRTTAPTEATGRDGYVIHESRGSLSSHWSKRDRLDGNVILPVCIGLAQRSLENAEKLLMQVSDPKSPNFARYLTPAKIARLFAPNQATISAVMEWLQNFGIKTTQIKTSASKGWLCFNMTVAEAERLLKTKYYTYEHKNGDRCPGTEEYYVPSQIQKHIDIVIPTVHLTAQIKGNPTQSNSLKKSFQKNIFKPIDAGSVTFDDNKMMDVSHCNEIITLLCLKTLYNFTNYKQRSSKKNKYGIVEYTPQSYSQADLNQFLSKFNPSANGIKPIIDFIDGAVLVTSDNGDIDIYGESNLDLQYSIGLVYPTPVTLYQTGDLVEGASFNNFLDAIDGSFCNFEGGDDPTEDGIFPDPNKDISGAYEGSENCGTYKPTYVISSSYTYDEADLTPAYERRQCIEYLKLGLLGITVMFSSGDYGVGGNGGYCIDPTSGDYTLDASGIKFNPTFPNTCPYVTAVGGTQINPGSSVYQPESVWNYKDISSSNGGFSNVFQMPDYQHAAVKSFLAHHKPPYSSTQYNTSGKARGYPDISANAYNYTVVIGGQYQLVGGTSASSPVFGSIITMINDARFAVNKASVGFINPVLYAYSHVLNDITSGHNAGCGTSGFSAVKGWDPVSGLGTPNFQKLLDVYLNLP